MTYVMPAPSASHGHRAMVVFGTTRNANDRYVTGEAIYTTGLHWPTPYAQTRDDLALLIGRQFLDAAGV